MNRQSTLLSKDPNLAIQEMMDTIDHLKAVYIEETKALTIADMRKFMAIQDQKIEAARSYHADMSQLLDRKEEIQTASPALKNRLKQMQTDFSSLSKENMQALERMQRCTQQLSDTLRNVAIEEVRKRKTFSYAENGAISTAQKIISSGISETA